MQELKHALTGGIYGIDPEDGLVRVEEAGKVGLVRLPGTRDSASRLR